MESSDAHDDSMDIDADASVVEVEAPEVKGKKREGAAYHWCFTLNNPKQKDGQKFLELVTSPDDGWGVEYLVFQLEKGKKKGTEHYQGYCEFTKAERMTSIKKKGHGAAEAHWEKRKGTPAQARDYCMKPEGRISLTYIYHAGLDDPWGPPYEQQPEEELNDAIRRGYERRWEQQDQEDRDEPSEPELWSSFHEGEDGYATPPTQ